MFPDGFLNKETGKANDGWSFDGITIVDPDGSQYSLTDGVYAKHEEVEEDSLDPETIKQACDMINEANKTLSTLKTIPERMEVLEQHYKAMQEYWDRPENREKHADAPNIEQKDGRQLFLDKGLTGLKEAAQRPTESADLNHFKELWDNLLITDGMMRHYSAETRTPYDIRGLKQYQEVSKFLKDYSFDLDEAVSKGYGVEKAEDAMHTAVQAAGGAWVPTGWSSQMIEFYRTARHVPGLFQTIQMPTNPYKPPIQTGRATIYNAGQATTSSAGAITSSRPTTSVLEFNAEKPAGRILWSGEMNEDSIIPVLPMLRSELPKAMVEAIEDAHINGVKYGTNHIDSDILALDDDDHRKMWDGLRYHASQNSAEYDVTSETTSYEYDDHVQGRMLMGKYAAIDNPSRFAWIQSYKAYLLSTVFTELKRADYIGLQNVTGLRGVVNLIGGSPVFVSEFVRQDLNASGVYDALTTTYTETIGVYRDGFQLGDRRNETIEVVRIARTDQFEIIIIKRCDFEAVYVPGTGESLSCVLYKIS